MYHPTKTAVERQKRLGFSLMEVLVVLAIFAMSTAFIMPSMSRMLDQTMSHAVFFEFQRQMSDLRREASRTGQAIRVIEPSPNPQEVQIALPTKRALGPEALSEDMPRILQLRSSWTYSLSPAMDIEAGGRCSVASADLIHQGRVVMSLKTEDGTCTFIRYQDEPRA